MKEVFFLVTDTKCVHVLNSLVPGKFLSTGWDKLQWTVCDRLKTIRGKKQDCTFSRGSLEDVTCERCNDKLKRMGWLK